MKLFQQLLVAPAALGLLAPVAATASELNFDGVDQYASQEQVTSISQFSDVQPTDWAYQALSNLIERYGCVAGYPDGTYRGQRAMTRFEAAALLNACLDRVTEVTDELKRLMAEFEKELAILKGRVDGLEAKVGELEANQFSTTTKLTGIATMTLGGAGETGFGDNVTANYDVRLNFDTSFTGKDLLRTTLRAGNFGDSVFGNGNTALEVAFQEESGADSVGINRLFYQFPVGESVTVTAGAKVRQDDMLAMWPSAYPADTILDLFTYAGARATYSLNLGAGVGLWYQKDGFSISANFVSNENSAEDSTLGVGEDYTATVQLGYAGENWGAAFAYTYGDGLGGSPFNVVEDWNAIGLSAYWQPADSGWVPGISTGFGYTDANVAGLGNQDVWSWMVGLQWTDMFVKGNALGMAIGSAGQVGGGKCGTGALCTGGLWLDDGQDTLAYELWYKFQVTDNISVTPAFFWIENSGASDTYGGLVKTTFKF
ncbi:iron uptake porin [Cyanobium sp. LEGE 06113]|uniref:iron uptake porin n=1 Tax=Cyanobium sp. LEGE 06113 TaxID=1297573 RepID=UPI001880C5BF|nr:iron uptake porin [Cyanobium sp. LEGE 06113]MBE9154561.1 carbohydrate porin [Cyanobium sp. LEGE 06113]